MRDKAARGRRLTLVEEMVAEPLKQTEQVASWGDVNEVFSPSETLTSSVKISLIQTRRTLMYYAF